MIAIHPHQDTLDTLEQVKDELEDLRRKYTTPIYACAVAVDAPPVIDKAFAGTDLAVLEGVRAPSHKGEGRRLGLVRWSGGVALPRGGPSARGTMKDPCRHYNIALMRELAWPEEQRMSEALGAARTSTERAEADALRFAAMQASSDAKVEAMLEEFERIAARAWACLPLSIRQKVSPGYMYPSQLRDPAYRWIALIFVMAWESDEHSGFVAHRVYAERGCTFCVEPLVRELERRVGTDRDDKARVLKAVGEIRGSVQTNSVWRGAAKRLDLPVERCRAVLSLDIVRATLRVIARLRRSVESGLPRESWQKAELVKAAGVSDATFDRMREAAGIEPGISGDTTRTYSRKEIQAIITAALLAPRKREWKRAAKGLQDLLGGAV